MLKKAANSPVDLALDPQFPYVLFSEKRGLLSKHRTVTAATLAFCAHMQTIFALEDPPHLYQFTGRGWQQL